jgi:HK97 family phage major capsid protein
MNTLRRSLQVETRILDHKRGVVEYVASDETLDSYREIIRAGGWRFNHFSKNAPFVDSHDYSSVEKTLGKVIDYKVKGTRLIETVQRAIDANLPDNHLVNIGWRLTEAGYLKAVSVGFWPVRRVTKWDSDAAPYVRELKARGLDKVADNLKPNTIHLEQEQIELSAVIIGANPNALAKARAAGVLNESEFALCRSRAEIVSRRDQSQPQKKHISIMSNKHFLAEFDRLTKGTKESIERLDRTVTRGDAGEFSSALRGVRLQLKNERRMAGNPFAPVDSQALAYWDGAIRKAIGKPMSAESEVVHRALGTESSPGSLLVTPSLAVQLFDPSPWDGAWKTLDVIPVETKASHIGVLTGRPTAGFVAEGADIGDNSAASAVQISGDVAQPLGVQIYISTRWLEDADRVVIVPAWLEAMREGIHTAIDYACFSGNGVSDAANGGITGIFEHGDVVTVAASAGGISASNLGHGDFINTIAAAAPGTLQRNPSWRLNPVFVPLLMKVRDGSGKPILRTMLESENPSSLFSLAGFPAHLSTGCPGTDGASKKVAVFGSGLSYAVMLRKDLVLRASPHPRWDRHQTAVQMFIRVRGQMKRGAMFAMLRTAAV